MGDYLNLSNIGFEESIRSEIYVDKTGLIEYTNRVIRTQQKYICFSRPRRFGKTMAADMLTAYYSRGCQSERIFADLSIAAAPSFKEHLNQYNVIFLNIQDFMSKYHKIDRMISKITEKVSTEVLKDHPSIDISAADDLPDIMQALFNFTKIPIIFILDEWDCIFREHKSDKGAQIVYLDFLRSLLKDKKYVALAYMTGILPIKKYGTHSALNMFREFSMTDPGKLAEFVGFTHNEVMTLCSGYLIDYKEMEQWYDGYRFPGLGAVYNPKSVVEAIISGRCNNYWSQTETFEALSVYIRMNFEGLKDTIVELMAGENKRVDIRTFTNDMVTFTNYNDVLTLLIHLGYLGYDFDTKEVFIPNKEIMDEFVSTVKIADWDEISAALNASDDLLKATWRGDAEAVARYMEKAHYETSVIQYNDENSLSCIISLAYYSAREYYTIVREMPAGKGFADLIFLPRKKYPDKPAMIVELKWDKTAAGAVRQIRDRQYDEILRDYRDNALLVGINYSKDTKLHECVIERI